MIKKRRKTKEEKRFDEVLKVMLNTPPETHEEMKDKKS